MIVQKKCRKYGVFVQTKSDYLKILIILIVSTLNNTF